MKVAMILAAGRGERLKPITEKIPKALCEVHSKPLIEHLVEQLAHAGFEQIVVNHAYLGGKIRQYLGDGSRFGVTIIYSPEPPGGLETGGGIVKALPYLGDEPFVTVNADIFTDFDFASLRTKKVEAMHLVLVDKNPDLQHPGDFGLDKEAKITNDNRDYTYPGIAVYHPQIFSNLKQGRYSLTPLLRKYVDQGMATGEVFQGVWFDIGTIERLRAVNGLN